MKSLPSLRPYAALVLGFLAVALLLVSRHEVQQEQTFQRALAQVKIVPPETAPELSQESIDLALVMYGIDVPPTAEHPTFDRGLTDRGLTQRATFMEKAKVTVGPAAFASWGLLGSTLAHELEVHCRQNFLAIWMMDLAGMDGTGAAERQAYAHELRNAKRFGLDVADADLIADTMDYYYPEDPRGRQMMRPLRTWLARNILRGQRSF